MEGRIFVKSSQERRGGLSVHTIKNNRRGQRSAMSRVLLVDVGDCQR